MMVKKSQRGRLYVSGSVIKHISLLLFSLSLASTHPMMSLFCVLKRGLVNGLIVYSVERMAAAGLGVGESLCVCSGACMCVNGNPADPDDLSFILYEYARRAPAI